MIRLLLWLALFAAAYLDLLGLIPALGAQADGWTRADALASGAALLVSGVGALVRFQGLLEGRRA